MPGSASSPASPSPPPSRWVKFGQAGWKGIVALRAGIVTIAGAVGVLVKLVGSGPPVVLHATVSPTPIDVRDNVPWNEFHAAATLARAVPPPLASTRSAPRGVHVPVVLLTQLTGQQPASPGVGSQAGGAAGGAPSSGGSAPGASSTGAPAGASPSGSSGSGTPSSGTSAGTPAAGTSTTPTTTTPTTGPSTSGEPPTGVLGEIQSKLPVNRSQATRISATYDHIQSGVVVPDECSTPTSCETLETLSRPPPAGESSGYVRVTERDGDAIVHAWDHLRFVLHHARARPVGDKRQILGAAVSLHLDMRDYDGHSADVVWSLINADTRRLAPEEWLHQREAAHLIARGDDDPRDVEFFIPLPQQAGRYFVRVRVFDDQGIERASGRSEAFS